MPAAPAQTAAPLLPERLSLKSLREAAAGCTACPLYENATQTVFGAGTVTVHPSSLLRIDDPDERRLARAEFERDLAGAWARRNGG